MKIIWPWKREDDPPKDLLNLQYCGVHCYAFGPGHHCDECHTAMKGLLK